MSDTVMARGNDSKFLPHEEGQFVAQAVDVIDLGDKVETFPGTLDKLSHKCAIVFRTGERNAETDDYIDIAREFTVSMGELANLRKFLEQWRGKPYDTKQIEEGVPLHKLTGNHALLTIAHKTSGKGRTYANITACVGVPKQMLSTVTKYSDYVREEYWATRKKEYAEGAAKFRTANKTRDDGDGEFDESQSYDEADQLPF